MATTTPVNGSAIQEISGSCRKPPGNELWKAGLEKNALGPPPAPPSKKPPPPPKQLRTSTALRYSKALHAIDRGDKKAAREELAQVVKEQPDFKLASLDMDKLIQ